MEGRREMTKEERELLNSVAEGFLTRLKGIESTINYDAFIYKDEMGKDHVESHAKYSDYLSRAMASDMFQFFVLLNLKNRETAGKLLDWTKRMNQFNFDLMRLFDDDHGNRPMTPWDYEGTKELADEIRETAAALSRVTDSKAERYVFKFLEKCGIWANRLAYMDVWAYCIENLKDIRETERYSQFEEFDHEGNKIGGLSAEKANTVKYSCRVRDELTRMLVHIGAVGKDHDYLMDILTRLKAICDELMEDSVIQPV